MSDLLFNGPRDALTETDVISMLKKCWIPGIINLIRYCYAAV